MLSYWEDELYLNKTNKTFAVYLVGVFSLPISLRYKDPQQTYNCSEYMPITQQHRDVMATLQSLVHAWITCNVKDISLPTKYDKNMIINDRSCLCFISIILYIHLNLYQKTSLDFGNKSSNGHRTYLDSRHSVVHGHAAPKTRYLWECPFHACWNPRDFGG